MSNQIHIYWMYPDVLNLHGDRGNVQALERVARKMGLEPIVHRIMNPQDPIDFDQADLMLFNPGELKSCRQIVGALSGRKEDIARYLDEGKQILVIGTSGTIFGQHVQRLGQEDFDGLGMLKINAKERRMILGDDLHCVLPDGTELMGSQIQMAEYAVEQGQSLAAVRYGRGNCGDGTEGAVCGGLIWTNLLGPVLVKNPWWAEQLLRKAAERKGIDCPVIEESFYLMERESMAACKAYIELKKEHKD